MESKVANLVRQLLAIALILVALVIINLPKRSKERRKRATALMSDSKKVQSNKLYEGIN